MQEHASSRIRIKELAANVRNDPFHYFPSWCRSAALDELRNRPLFIVGNGFGEGVFLSGGPRGPLDIRGLVETRYAEFLVDGALWHLGYPAARRLERMVGDRLPHWFGVLRRAGVQALASGMSAAGRMRIARLGVARWLERAKAIPNSLSIIITQGPDARRYRRLARDHGIDALVVCEALRTPAFADLATGQFNDLIGDMPTRIEEFLALESVLADEESVRVLHAVLAYRLTLDHDELDPVLHHPWREYFGSGLFRWGDDETLYDVGAFTGDTLLRFMDATGGRFRRAVCLEPDDRNFFFLQKMYDSLGADAERVVIRKQGAWHEQTRLQFQATGDMGARIGNDASVSKLVSIDVTTIDALAEELGPPTLVKCDAEGADRDVLAGGSRTFAAHKSRIAVSAYHLQDDLLALTGVMRAANPDYQISLRQYFSGHWDTVLYAY
ncbi:MAG: Methyltransferase FkbM [Myxococcales bacterium]|nr:Methyltransferase FkbM [Myxococcales bacterium]